MADVSSILLGAIDINVFSDFPWALILNTAMANIGLYALRIILLTLCIKIVLFPFDLFQRYKMRKNQVITMRIQPQIDKLEKAYAGNAKVLQQKKTQLNRKEGMSYFASCLPMILTLVIFIWFWNTLQTTGQYKQFKNYLDIYDVYTTAYSDSMGDYYDETNNELVSTYGSTYRDKFDVVFGASYVGETTVDEAVALANTAALNEASSNTATKAETETEYYELYTETYSYWVGQGVKKGTASYDYATIATVAASTAADYCETYCGTSAQTDVYDYYFSEGKFEGKGYQHDSFLWIKDIWFPDVPWTAFVKSTKSDFTSAVGSYATDPARSGKDADGNLIISEGQLKEIVDSYETVMALVIADSGRTGVNGFLIIPILAVLLNVLTQIITRRQQKQSGQTQMMDNGGQSGCLMKAMIFVLPVMVGYFAIMYCAAFSLYMLTNSACSLIINLISTVISKKMVPIAGTGKGGKNGGAGASEELVMKYGRPDPSASKNRDNK